MCWLFIFPLNFFHKIFTLLHILPLCCSLYCFHCRYAYYGHNRYFVHSIARPSGSIWYHIVFNFSGENTNDAVKIYHDFVPVACSNLSRVLSSINFADGTIFLNRALTGQLGTYGSFQIAQLLFFNQALIDIEIAMLSNISN